MQSSRRSPVRTRFGQILDTSGKSAAFLHHRTIRQTRTWPRNGGDRRKCQTNTASPAEPEGLPVMLGLGKCPRLKGQDRKEKPSRQPLVSSAVHLAYADIFRSAQPIARNVATINRRAPLTACRPIPTVNRPSSARCAKTYCNAT